MWGTVDIISWFLHQILRPLLNYVPAHLANTDEFLHKLRNCDIPNTEVEYQTFDVSALYTNVDADIAIACCVSDLREHQEELQLYGLVPEEIEELYVTVKFNIFRFNNVI